MDIYSDLNTALYSRLSASAGTALWGSRIYAVQAPTTAPYPYLVYEPVYVGRENLSKHDSFRAIYSVMVYGTTQSDVRTGLGHVTDSLHNAPLTLSSMKNILIRTGEAYLVSQTVDNQIIYGSGTEVIMMLSEN